MELVRSNLTSQGIKFDRSAAEDTLRHQVLDVNLHNVIIDSICVCDLFNHGIGNRQIDLVTFQEMVYSICYRLLNFRPLDDPSRTSVQAAYHIGLTMIVMSMFLRFDRRRVLDYRFLTCALSDTLDSWPVDADDELLLWLVMVGGIWVSGALGNDWLHQLIRRTSRKLGVESWDSVLDIVKTFPWIHALHDAPGRELWETVQVTG